MPLAPNASHKPRVLISTEQIQKRVIELAAQISKDYAGQEIMGVCILKGSSLFFADMIRHIDLPLRCEFMAISSYGNEKKSSGEVKLVMDVKYPVEGKHVIVFEDIVDSGLTINYITHLLGARNPASIKLCSLLLKPASLKKPITVDYVGFEIGNEFVLGYGLDYEGLYRGLPYIGVFEQ